MKDNASLDSFRSSLDANYEWPCKFPFKFIVPKDQKEAALDLFTETPIRENPSSSGKFIAYTIEVNVHSGDEVISIYQRMAQIPGVISL